MHSPSHILIVEDNEDDSFLLQRALKTAKIECSTRIVSNGQEALCYLSGTEEFSDRSENPFPELIFLDLNMPRLTGFQLLSWISKDSFLRSIPVVIVSSSLNPLDVEAGKEFRILAWLPKPVGAQRIRELNFQSPGPAKLSTSM